MKPPADLPSLRAFFDSIDWVRMEEEVASEARARLAIVGPVNSGKSTLFNLLKGQAISEVSAVPGTTQAAVVEHFGPFTLVDTPGLGEALGDERVTKAREEIGRARLVVLLLDAAAGVRQSDLDLYYSIRAEGIPVIVGLNKVDLVRRDLRAILNDLSFRLQGTRVVPVSARTGQGVTDQLIPAIIQANEAAAVVVGRALPAYRASAAKQVIDTTMWWALLLGAEPIPGLDLPLLLGMQARMVLRLAAIYGENFTARHARELLTTMAGGLVTRYLALELAKFVPALGWVVSGIIAALGTRAMGKVAEMYFASGHRLTAEQLRALYRRLFRRPREAPTLPPSN
ncbi:MAG TPA: GTP-binding protein [Anaerolineales bacterium]|nr:GTP-binding protein [Anaerolineales bacterium]